MNHAASKGGLIKVLPRVTWVVALWAIRVYINYFGVAFSNIFCSIVSGGKNRLCSSKRRLSSGWGRLPPTSVCRTLLIHGFVEFVPQARNPVGVVVNVPRGGYRIYWGGGLELYAKNFAHAHNLTTPKFVNHAPIKRKRWRASIGTYLLQAVKKSIAAATVRVM